jgi:hypothetical protein
VRGSSILQVLTLGWSSDEYIGQGVSLPWSTADMLGATETSISMDGNITATATLTKNANVDGVRVLESTLHITAVEASVVTCTSGVDGSSESIELSISGTYLVYLVILLGIYTPPLL